MHAPQNVGHSPYDTRGVGGGGGEAKNFDGVDGAISWYEKIGSGLVRYVHTGVPQKYKSFKFRVNFKKL